MSSSSPYDDLEFERLYQRLLHQHESAFFCITLSAGLSHVEIVEEMVERLPVGKAQIIDFKNIGSDYRFSSDFLSTSIKEGAHYIFLANFQLARGDMSEAEFFQVLNLSRDALIELPVVLIFMMPLYFRIEIARKTPDFNSFFGYRADFESEVVKHAPVDPSPTDEYSEAKHELLKYYMAVYNKLTDFRSKKAFETVLQILKLNTFLRTLSSVEQNRFYSAFMELLPLYQNEFDGSPSDIADIYDGQGDYEKALEWYYKALNIYEKTIGKEHPSTATTYNNIALVYKNQGNYEKALEWFYKALNIYEKTIGKEHPSAAATYNNIAGVCNDQGNYEKALEWYHKALDIYEKTIGKEHPSAAATYNNIALVYKNQGNYEKALEWYHKALDICEKTIGKEHPSTAITYNNIALVYNNQGNYEKALEWFYKALDIKEKTIGKEHPSTANTYNNIACVYDNQGDNEKALEWFYKALDIKEKTIGKEHPSTAITYNNIAGVYKDQGDHSEALDWRNKASKSPQNP
ncbi:MAG: tetratricopeptide repeat protein [Oscillospiraceae bacterium]|nr:tetratricopeptide repeat protein [Oscillospiraceae bacterium]